MAVLSGGFETTATITPDSQVVGGIYGHNIYTSGVTFPVPDVKNRIGVPAVTAGFQGIVIGWNTTVDYDSRGNAWKTLIAEGPWTVQMATISTGYPLAGAAAGYNDWMQLAASVDDYDGSGIFIHMRFYSPGQIRSENAVDRVATFSQTFTGSVPLTFVEPNELLRCSASAVSQTTFSKNTWPDAMYSVTGRYSPAQNAVYSAGDTRFTALTTLSRLDTAAGLMNPQVAAYSAPPLVNPAEVDYLSFSLLGPTCPPGDDNNNLWGKNPSNFHARGGRNFYSIAYVSSGGQVTTGGAVRCSRSNFGYPPYVSSAVVDSGTTNNFPSLTETPDSGLLAVYQKGATNSEQIVAKSSYDDGASWGAQTELFAAGVARYPTVTSDPASGRVIVAAYASGTIVAKAREAGDEAFGSQFTLVDSTGANIAVSNTPVPFDLEYDLFNSRALHLIVRQVGGIRHFVSYDDGASFTLTRTLFSAAGLYPVVAFDTASGEIVFACQISNLVSVRRWYPGSPEPGTAANALNETGGNISIEDGAFDLSFSQDGSRRLMIVNRASTNELRHLFSCDDGASFKTSEIT